MKRAVGDQTIRKTNKELITYMAYEEFHSKKKILQQLKQSVSAQRAALEMHPCSFGVWRLRACTSTRALMQAHLHSYTQTRALIASAASWVTDPEYAPRHCPPQIKKTQKHKPQKKAKNRVSAQVTKELDQLNPFILIIFVRLCFATWKKYGRLYRTEVLPKINLCQPSEKRFIQQQIEQAYLEDPDDENQSNVVSSNRS